MLYKVGLKRIKKGVYGLTGTYEQRVDDISLYEVYFVKDLFKN